MSFRKFLANMFAIIVNVACLFTFFAVPVNPLGYVIGCFGLLGIAGQVIFSLNREWKSKRVLGNVFMAFPVGVCLFTLLSFTFDGLIIGGIGLVGLFGVLLFNTTVAKQKN